jgi:hypothetical protein
VIYIEPNGHTFIGRIFRGDGAISIAVVCRKCREPMMSTLRIVSNMRRGAAIELAHVVDHAVSIPISYQPADTSLLALRPGHK